MPAKRRNQVDRLGRLRRRQKRLAGGKAAGRDPARGSAGGAPADVGGAGKHVVRRESGSAGGVRYEITHYDYREDAPEQPTPRGPLFYSGDPTLAKRAEDELRKLDG